MRRFDVVVLGGGIIGAAIAEELARRRSRVCVIERGSVGCEASKAAAGILSAQMDVERPGPFFDLCQTARRLYPAWIRHLERVSKLNVGFDVSGVLYVTRTRAQTRQMDARMHWQLRQGLPVECLASAQIARREPAIAGHQFQAGFLFPAEGQVDNARLMDALALACRRAGVTVFERTEVRQLIIRRNRVASVETNRFSCSGSVVVNCLGSWAQLGGLRALTLPVVPAKGQMLCFAAPCGMFQRPVMSHDAYGVQRRDGRLIVGSTVEFAGYDKRLTFDGMHTILSGFRRMVDPALMAQCPLLETWVGLRPCSRDQMPIIGQTSIGGLLAATGHFRHGILLAPVTAKAVADVILTGHSAIDLAPFSPDRFARRREPARLVRVL